MPPAALPAVAPVRTEPAHETETLPDRVRRYPKLRFMGSKHRLLSWIHGVFGSIDFESALDAFSGSGCVSYLLKAMGKTTWSNDFLRFPNTVAKAIVENSRRTIEKKVLDRLLKRPHHGRTFILRTFKGIFFKPADLRFLDQVWTNLEGVSDPYVRSLVVAALIRSCVKRQPRGVFTVAGDPAHYKDGRRDIRLSIEEHFLEQTDIYNQCVFDNGVKNRAIRSDAFRAPHRRIDLVYLDPPYVPRADDNCYIKRYHFLEGLSCYWDGLELLKGSKVKKIVKPFTPFSYRRTALPAFDRLFHRFRKSIIVLSYSSNGYPDLDELVSIMRRYKTRIAVHGHAHRYHFGTHDAALRTRAQEYLIVGR
jgi:adenine-specific DNA-methyltransferase